MPRSIASPEVTKLPVRSSDNAVCLSIIRDCITELLPDELGPKIRVIGANGNACLPANDLKFSSSKLVIMSFTF